MYNNVLIYGYGKSGKSVESIIKNLDIKYKIYDDKYDNKFVDDIFLKTINKKQLVDFDLIVISPGVSVYNENVLFAKKNGIKVIGELEFAYWFLNKPIVAITGTNGKTTTTRLIGDIINNNYRCECFGNIGNPLSQAIGFDCDYIVCEVSSFQLESIDKFKPDISVILNIDEDHIDRHKTLKNYIDCKFNLVKNSDMASLVILNADDENINMVSGKEIEILDIDNHQIHIDSHTAFMLDKTYRNIIKTNNKLKDKFLEHIKNHKIELEKMENK